LEYRRFEEVTRLRELYEKLCWKHVLRPPPGGSFNRWLFAQLTTLSSGICFISSGIYTFDKVFRLFRTYISIPMNMFDRVLIFMKLLHLIIITPYYYYTLLLLHLIIITPYYF
jgi:hypothetical protein